MTVDDAIIEGKKALVESFVDQVKEAFEYFSLISAISIFFSNLVL